MDEIGISLKFYYLDDDNDLISITSQGDLQEALQYQIGKVNLKVVIAKNA